MDTEITEYNKEWLFYDGDCEVCRAWAGRLERRLKKHQIAIAPLQSDKAVALLAIAPGKALNEMKLVTVRGEVLGGADAFIYLTKCFWWGRGLRLLARVPGVRFVLRRAYAALARRRYCLKGGCRL